MQQLKRGYRNLIMANIRLLLVKQARFLGLILLIAQKNTAETSTGCKQGGQGGI